MEKTRQRLEAELLEALRQRQAEWISASDENRDAAPQRVREALRAFNNLIRYDKSLEAPEADALHGESGQILKSAP